LRRLAASLVGLGLLVGVPVVALGQAGDAGEKSFFLNFVQDRLSTPDRQIAISNIDGALSSVASIREIDVSDQTGVYLKIKNIKLDWNQSALLTGRLDVNSLAADSIEYLRNPIPAPNAAPALPAPEAQGMAVPQLPVAVDIRQLAVPKITFGEQVFGLGSSIALAGKVKLEGGSLDAGLDIKRLDGPGGALALAAKYDKDSTKLDLDLGIDEPQDGIIATLLNVEGRPDIRLDIKGSGPVGALTTQLSLAAAGKSVLTGKAEVTQQDDVFAIAANLGGPIADILPAAYRGFFGDSTALAAKALLRSDGGLEVEKFSLAGGEVRLAGSASTSKDWFLNRLELSGDIASADGTPVLLPVSGAATRLDSGHIEVKFGGGSPTWQANIAATGFSNATLTAKTLGISGSGVAANLDDPAQRRLTFNVDGKLDGVASSDRAVAAALGDSIGLGAAGLWSAGQPLELAQFRLLGKALTLDTAGSIAKGVFNGEVNLATRDIGAFSGVAGRSLAGGVTLAAKGSISPLIGGFDLDLDGTGTDLAFDNPAVDKLLKGTVKLTGGLARTADGVAARQFRLANAQVQAVADGQFASDAADFRFDLQLADLGLVSPHAAGTLAVTGAAKGSDGAIGLNFAAQVPAGTLLERPLRAATLGFHGTLRQGKLSGELSGGGSLGEQPITLAAQILSADGSDALHALRFRAGGASLTGDVTHTKAGLFEGQLKLAADDISTAAALALVEAKGAAQADITLTPQGKTQAVSVTASARAIKFGGSTVASAEIRAGVADLFGVPMVNGTVAAKQVVASGVSVDTLAATAKWDGEATNFSTDAALAGGARLAAAGALAPLGQAGYRLALDKMSLQQGKLSARLAAPATLSVNGDTVQLGKLRFDVGGGSLTATGSAGKALDIAVALSALPLSAANAVAPGLGLAGSLDGTVRLTGSAAAPKAAFTLKGHGIGAKAIGAFGITPLAFEAIGEFANGRVQLARLTASSPAGLALTGKGTLPLSLTGLDLDASGSVPLALANRFVAARGGQASGTAKFAAHIGGSASSPKVTGEVSLDGGTYVDPAANLKLVGIALRATLAGSSASLNRFSANVSTGGSISGTGKVSLAPGYAGDFALKLTHLRYVDEPLLVTTLSGDLSIKGKLLEGPVIGGAIGIERAEISVPGQIGGGAAAIKVRHLAPPKPVAASLARVRGGAGKSAASGPSASANGPRLDLTINAPARIFIRGRGLDAEVGGSLRLTGRLDAVAPVGAFHLIRGRLAILGQNLTFDSGSATLTGSLDPQIALSATVPSDNITVKVSVSGYASDPKIDFTSTPALAQDEVLSRLLFKQGVEKLSPLQLAQLAGAAASLAGNGGSSLLDDLRNSTGLDDLNLTTDATGAAAVTAGRYITDKIYLGVQAGASGKSRVTVNLDLAPGLKANAGTGADGDSGVGVLYERDY
jgi:translocation and assembly module TamB